MPGTHHVEQFDEDMPGQPSLPLPQPLVDERSWCNDHGTPRADNDKLIDSSPLTGGVKVVRPRFAAGAPPGPLRTRRRAWLSAVESWAMPAQRKRSLLRPLTRPRSFRHAVAGHPVAHLNNPALPSPYGLLAQTPDSALRRSLQHRSRRVLPVRVERGPGCPGSAAPLSAVRGSARHLSRYWWHPPSGVLVHGARRRPRGRLGAGRAGGGTVRSISGRSLRRPSRWVIPSLHLIDG